MYTHAGASPNAAGAAASGSERLAGPILGSTANRLRFIHIHQLIRKQYT